MKREHEKGTEKPAKRIRRFHFLQSDRWDAQRHERPLFDSRLRKSSNHIWYRPLGQRRRSIRPVEAGGPPIDVWVHGCRVGPQCAISPDEYGAASVLGEGA